MVKYIVLVLVGCLLIAQSVEAENKNTRQVGIGLGLFAMRSKDNLASPFTYNGDGRGWLIKYRAQNAKRRHHISFMWDTGLLTSSITRGRNHRVELTRIQARYAYHRSFRSESPGRIRLLWGVVQQAFFHFRRQFYSQSRREYFGELIGSCNLQSHCNLNGHLNHLYLMACLYPRLHSYGVMPMAWVEAETSIQQVCTNF